jgi:hypothetical protein
MIDYIYIGTTPAEEPGLQLGLHSYGEMRQEALYYIAALKKKFPHDKINLVVRREFHDFGEYPAVIIRYDDSDEESVNQAFNIEANEPSTWEELGVEPFKLPTA